MNYPKINNLPKFPQDISKENAECTECNSRAERRARHKIRKKAAKKAIKAGDHEAAKVIFNEIEQEKIESAAYHQIKCLIRESLSKTEIIQIAHETGFQIRQRETEPLAIIAILMMGCVEEGVETLSILCAFLRKWFATFIKPQSLQEIINRPQTTIFFKKLWKK